MSDYQCKKDLIKYDLYNNITFIIRVGDIWESGDEREGANGWEYKMETEFNWFEFWINEHELKEHFVKIKY